MFVEALWVDMFRCDCAFYDQSTNIGTLVVILIYILYISIIIIVFISGHAHKIKMYNVQ